MKFSLFKIDWMKLNWNKVHIIHAFSFTNFAHIFCHQINLVFNFTELFKLLYKIIQVYNNLRLMWVSDSSNTWTVIYNTLKYTFKLVIFPLNKPVLQSLNKKNFNLKIIKIVHRGHMRISWWLFEHPEMRYHSVKQISAACLSTEQSSPRCFLLYLSPLSLSPVTRKVLIWLL